MVIQWLEVADKLQGFYVVCAILHEMACIFYHKHNMTIDITHYMCITIDQCIKLTL